MRFVRVMVVVVLLISLAANFIMYTKFRSKRPVLTVNGTGVSKKDIDDYLEQQAGPNVKASMVQRIMVDQEAKKQGIAPTDAEIEEEFKNQKELNWQFAREVGSYPWMMAEKKSLIRDALAKQRLLVKETAVTEEEMKEEYNSRAALYDTPNKAKCNLAVIFNEGQKGDVEALMRKNDPPVSPTVIMQQYRGGAVFLGDENKFTFVQPFGMPKQNEAIFNMKKGDVKMFPPMEFQRQGAKAVIVRMLDILPGKKADMNDPKTKEKLKTAVAIRRSKPWQEYLSTLWASTKFESEDPNDRKYIESLWFPDRAKTDSK